MSDFEKDLVATMVIEMAMNNAKKLMCTHTVEFLKFLSKEKTMQSAEDATKLLIMAAVTFIMKSFEASTKPIDFTPEELNDNLTEFLVEFMEKRS